MRFRADGAVVDRLDVLVDPGVAVPLAIQRLTGLTDADIAGGPSPAEAVAMLAEFSRDAALVAHGAGFDIAHCTAILPDVFARRPCLDTLEIVRILLPTAGSHSLPLLSASLGIEHTRPHRADSDADATRSLLLHLVEVAADLPAEVLSVIRSILAPLGLPLTTFFSEVVTAPGNPRRPAVAGPRRPAGAVVEGPNPLLDRALPLDAAVTLALGPTGPVAAGLAAYERREPQVEMARAVAQTLDRSGRLLVEAGTGTGKSIAYLTPLALWTAREGRRAVVATHTVTLQEQLAERDLPALLGQLGIPATAAMLKGRQHYLSLRRWQRMLAGLAASHRRRPDLDTLRFGLRVLCWLARTGTGDRAELRLGGVEEELWRRVESTVDDCLGPACPNWRDASCYMVAARRTAAAADLVVTNQALLVADTERQGQVLTAFDALVVDEAQHLEETATRALGTRLRAADILGVIDRVRAGDEQEGEEEEDSRGTTPLAAARAAVQRLFGEVRAFVGAATGQENPGNAVVAIGPDQRDRPELDAVRRSAGIASTRVRRAAAAILAARDAAALQVPLLPDAGGRADELSLAAAALTAHADAIERVVLAPGEGHVAWLEIRAENGELREAPVSVAATLAERLFERLGAVVLTSATLSVAGDFDFVRGRTGIGGAETLRLGSPFDYLRQAVTVLVSDMPPYDAAAYDPALARVAADIAVRLGGRTLVLFTGYAPLRTVHHLLGQRLDAEHIALLGQGIDGTRRQVLASFLQNPRSVLLGTSSFWEGIDLPGDAVRCVVIAKLPFPVPTDPLTAARGALVGDPFSGLALPIAVLRLRQGFGRLIRHSDDRGAVVLCDTRVLSRDYGRAFLAALPEAAMARSTAADTPALVEDFVATGRIPEAARMARPIAATPADDGDRHPAHPEDPDVYPHPDDEGAA